MKWGTNFSYFVRQHPEIARPPADRLPILSHWGVTGGDLFGLAEGRLAEVDFEVV